SLLSGFGSVLPSRVPHQPTFVNTLMEASMSIFAITQTQISHAVPNNTMPRMIRIIGIVARKQSDRELANGYTRPWALRRFGFLLSCNPLLWVCVAAARRRHFLRGFALTYGTVLRTRKSWGIM